MKFLKVTLVVFIIQFFYIYQIGAENLNAVRIIVNGEIITEFDIRQRTAEAFRIAREQYTEAGLESKKEEIVLNAIDELIDRKILVQEAKKVVLADPAKAEEIEKNVEAFVKGASSK